MMTPERPLKSELARRLHWSLYYTLQEKVNRAGGFYDAAVWYQSLARAVFIEQVDPVRLHHSNESSELCLLFGGRRPLCEYR
jgi:hypothetical protein